MKPALGRALFNAVEALDALGIRYALVGGLAVGAWGVNRSTRDVDLYAELREPARPALERALIAHRFHVPAMEAELERFGVFRSRSAEGVFVDIFNAVGPLGEAVLAGRKSAPLAGTSLWLVAPEDLAILKAFSERPRDFEDLTKLCAVVGARLNVAYVQGWARRLDESVGGDEVSDRFRRALEAGRGTRASRRRKRS